MLIDGAAELDVGPHSAARYLKEMLQWNCMGHADGRTLFVTKDRRELLFGALEEEKMGREAQALEAEDVDVKDLLELGRIVVERSALDWIFGQHESDLAPVQRFGKHTWTKEPVMESGAEMVVEAA